jgi:hypothetical protein
VFGKTHQQREFVSYQHNIIWKSIGYHAFNTYAFAFLKQHIPQHDVWHSPIFAKIEQYLHTTHYKLALEAENLYGYPYNPPGFEVPVSLAYLSDMDDKELVEAAQYWVNNQLGKNYTQSTQMLDRNTTDPQTLTARIYEITRLPDRIAQAVHIDVDSIKQDNG